MSLFIRKPLDLLQAEAAERGSGSLKRVLGPVSLIAIGVGTIVGAGLFSITGLVAASNAGPAIALSFIIASVCCCFAGLCYAEFASMIPIAGSAYTYSYATMGELVAWVIGWDLVLEYSVAATTVSISWSRYLVSFLDDVGISLPHNLTACPWDGGIVNIPAFLIVVLISLLLVRGTKESAVFNTLVVLLKIGVIVAFVILGWKYINTDNYTPFIPENTGVMGEFGISGVFRGAAIVFFAYLGFDVVSTTAQETKNSRRNMPIGILGSLAVCLVLYLLFAHVMTGVVHYSSFSGKEGIAPVAVTIAKMGTPDASGVIQPAYPWLNKAIVLAILIGYCSVIMGTLMAQSRIFMSMSRDGMLPPFFSKLHKKYRTPAPQQPASDGGCGLAGRLYSCQCGRRDGEYRHTLRLHLGLRRHYSDAPVYARRASRLQGAARALGSGTGHRLLSGGGAQPAGRYMDTSRVVDARGLRRLLRLRHAAQPSRAGRPPQGCRHLVVAGCGSVGVVRHHWTVASILGRLAV